MEKVSSNAFANGSRQNCGNVITDRSTTRLHAPPGGKSSVSLTWESPPAQPPQQHKLPLAPAKNDEPGLQENQLVQPRELSSNAFANGANQNVGNFITDRSTTRLHAPPGGQSSISLSWD